jgi:hypothetical protein
MFDFKIGGIAAGAAFIISFLISLVSGALMPVLIIRPLVFAALFFGIVWAVYFIIGRFLPELLDGSAGGGMDFAMPGSRIDISEGDGLGPDMPESGGIHGTVPGDMPGSIVIPDNYALPDDSDEGLGDISNLVKTGGGKAEPARKTSENPVEALGLDQGSQNEYTEEGLPDTFSVSGDDSAVAGAQPVDFLPDLESLAGAFMPSPGETGDDTIEYSTAAPAKPSASAKGRSLNGDFNPKDMAAGIRTILNKEE